MNDTNIILVAIIVVAIVVFTCYTKSKSEQLKEKPVKRSGGKGGAKYDREWVRTTLQSYKQPKIDVDLAM